MKEKICIVGLGYVGLPLAVALKQKGYEVIAFDINEEKIKKYQMGIDVTKEVGDDKLIASNLDFTYNIDDIKKSTFYIVSVPTPVRSDKLPDLGPLKSATNMLSKVISSGDVIVYESTVYPGVTEEICVGILENGSSLKYLEDFKVGFSPERINPADPINKLENIVKVVSGSDSESLARITAVYESIIDAGVHQASCIKVAEASKIIENTQRDVNIAFMNEVSILFEKLNINTKEVIEAASTKWNFMPFTPGLVGGHCIGVDPYYLIYKAQENDITPKIMMATREINDYMSIRLALKIVKNLVNNKVNVHNAKIGVFGLSFKADCPDTRNSKIFDTIDHLKSFGIEVLCYDNVADQEELLEEYNLKTNDLNDFKNLDSVIVSINHTTFKDFINPEFIKSVLNGKEYNTLYDIKWLLDGEKVEENGINYWSL